MYTGRPTYTMTEIDGQESIEIKKGLIEVFSGGQNILKYLKN